MTETPERGLSRRTLLRTGLVGGGIAAVGAATLLKATPALAGTYQTNWGYCGLCNEIFWAGPNFVGQGRCPAQPLDGHALGGTNYSAMMNFSNSGNPADPSSAGQQAGWHWCTKCDALVWGGASGYWNNFGQCVGNPTSTGSGPHVVGSTNYAVPFGINSPTYQDGWDYCSACGVLYWGDGWGRDGGNCWPRTQYYWSLGGGPNPYPHTHGSSTHYQFIFT
jgi:hypothetical protein